MPLSIVPTSCEPRRWARGFQSELLPVVGETMAPIVRRLGAFARQPETLLLLGETGTGKSRLARWVHSTSPRAGGAFEVVDLNAVPGDLQQAELFGWDKGAFTGAGRSHEGAVARAEGGTLFIDEIDKLDRRGQAALLRLLEEGRFRVLGGRTDRAANVRFVIGTNVELERSVERGEFLSDLYYRIHVLPIRLPPLRERLDEVTAWVRFMVARRAEEDGGRGRMSDEAIAPMLSYAWPGNLRQLDNVVRRAWALARFDLDESPDPDPDAEVLPLRREHVEAALQMERRAPAQARADLVDALARAAKVVVSYSFAQAPGDRIELDTIVSSFRAQVLLGAVERCATVEIGFELVGKANLVSSGNHQRALRNARQQVTELSQRSG